MDNIFDLVVIGHGAAGLASALSAIQSSARKPVKVIVLERTDSSSRGGNTRWTGAYLRLQDLYEVAPDLLADAEEFSQGFADLSYWQKVIDELPAMMEWLQDTGIRLVEQSPTFVARSRPRLSPVGGGDAIMRHLLGAVTNLGGEIRYQTTATDLLFDDEGVISGVRVRLRDGRSENIKAKAVIIASGGFEGNAQMMAKFFGSDAHMLRTLAPGGLNNKGEGITMALRVGAKASGQWDLFHATLIDPRSNQPDSGNAGFPYGILVNQLGERFTDEGANTVDEIYEGIARIVRTQPGGISYLIGDQKLLRVPNIDRAIRTDKKPVIADSLQQLGEQLNLPISAFLATVESFNGSIATDFPLNPQIPDGRSTSGISPPKSNWSQTIDEPPFLAYPVQCAIVFTFGGIATSLDAEVLTNDGVPIPGLYSAGECTGVYYRKYLGATSVLRSLVFGRIAGIAAAHYVQEPAGKVSNL